MASIDYSLQVARLLAPVRFDDIPPIHDPRDQFVPPGDVMADGFFRGYVAIRHVTADLAALGADALPAITGAAEAANYYELLAIVDSVAALAGDLDAERRRETRDWLLPYLDYEDSDVQRRAVQALTELGESSAAAHIEPLCEGPGLLQSCARYAMSVLSPDRDQRFDYLVRTLIDGDDKALRDLLAEPDDRIPWDDVLLLLGAPQADVRESVQREVSRVRSIPVELTLRLTHDDHPPVRFLAIETLGRSNDAACFEVMFAALQDPEKRIANFAKRWLGASGVDFQDRLRPLLDCTHSLTRRLALDLLATPLSESLIGAVADLLQTRSTIAMRRAAIRKLKPHAGDARARAALLDALIDPTADVRKSALGALQKTATGKDLSVLERHFGVSGGKDTGRLVQSVALAAAVASPKAVELLCTQLGHPDAPVRRAAIVALGELHAYDSAAAVRAAQDADGFGRSQEEAARHLERLADTHAALAEYAGDDEARKLLAGLCSSSAKSRMAALGRLTSLDEPMLARPVLDELLFDKSAEVRRAAITLLARHPDIEVLRLLRRKLEDNRRDELSCAIEALAALGDSGDADRIAAFLDHYDQSVRSSAVAALEALGDPGQREDVALAEKKTRAIEILRDQKLSDAQKVAAWQGVEDGVQALFRDLATDDGTKAGRIMLAHGWQPQRPVERAIALLCDDAPDWQTFPEEAIAILEPVFTTRWEERWRPLLDSAVSRWPEACKPFVVEALHAGRQGVASRALHIAREAGLFTAEELHGWIDTQDDPTLHNAAVRLLGWSGDVSLVPAFIDKLGAAVGADQGGYAASLLLALGDLGDERALPAVAALLDDPNVPVLGRYVVQAIGGIAGKESTRLLVYALRQCPNAVASIAAKSLAARDWQPEGELDRARLALHLRRSSIDSFDERALPAIAEYAMRETELHNKELLDWFTRFADPLAIEAVARAKWSYLPADKRKQAIAYFRDNADAAAPILIGELERTLDKLYTLERKDAGPTDVASRVLDWLTALKRPESADVLMAMLGANIPDYLQRSAAEALGKLGYRDAAPKVTELFRRLDDNADRRVLAEALMRMGDPVSLPVLVDARERATHAPLRKMLDRAIARLEKASAAAG